MRTANYSTELTYSGEPSKTPILEYEQTLLDDNFLIRFRCINQFLQLTKPYRNSTSEPHLADEDFSCLSSTTDDVTSFLVPWHKLYRYMELSMNDRQSLRDMFSAAPIPPEILDRILPGICKFAREIIDESEFDMDNLREWQIGVNLYITILNSDEDDDMDQDCESSGEN